MYKLFPGGISPIEGVRLGVAGGNVALMSGTNRDENNLFSKTYQSPACFTNHTRHNPVKSHGDL